MSSFLQILIAVVGSSALFSFLTFLIQRRDKRTDDSEKILKKINKMEQDITRTQLLLLISDYPEDRSEILKVAQYYFLTLDGDWYMTTLFKKWSKENLIEPPDWFKR